jgi:hypothetical protein
LEHATPTVEAIESEGPNGERNILSLLISNAVEGIRTGNTLRELLTSDRDRLLRGTTSRPH